MSLDLLIGTPVLLSEEICSTHVAEVFPKIEIIQTAISTSCVCRVRPQVRIEIEIDELEIDELQQKLENLTRFPAWVNTAFANRIKRLNCFELVREMLLEGIPTVEVARKIHSLGEAETLKLETLRQRLEHYKATLPKWMMVARQQPKQYLEVKKKADQAIDIMEKLAKLYEMIEKRLENSMSLDEKFGLITPGIERSFLVAKDLLMTVQLMREKLGIGAGQERAAINNLQNVNWGQIYGRESVTKVMNDPVSRARVIGVAERLIDLYGKKLTQEQIEQLIQAKNALAARPVSDLIQEETIDSSQIVD